jgi:hypothetical protein
MERERKRIALIAGFGYVRDESLLNPLRDLGAGAADSDHPR